MSDTSVEHFGEGVGQVLIKDKNNSIVRQDAHQIGSKATVKSLKAFFLYRLFKHVPKTIAPNLMRTAVLLPRPQHLMRVGNPT